MRGLRMEDTHNMTLGMWVDYIVEWNNINLPHEKTERKAVQKDFDMF